LFAEQLSLTAATGAGPFHPDKMPLDTDNDLLIVNDAITPAVGDISHLTGRVLTGSGQPVRNAVVEIWQVDHKGSYIHTQGANRGGRDGNFQGYGRFLTGSTGEYYFRTIKPISYTLQRQFRAAHIHIAVARNGRRLVHDADRRQWTSRQREGLRLQRPRPARAADAARRLSARSRLGDRRAGRELRHGATNRLSSTES
jgi:protocatechuate 3,4-dioxygenase beta subunit